MNWRKGESEGNEEQTIHKEKRRKSKKEEKMRKEKGERHSTFNIDKSCVYNHHY